MNNNSNSNSNSNREFKVFVSPNFSINEEYQIAKMPETFKSNVQATNLHLEKKEQSYEIEDRQRFNPDLYEGFLENQQNEGCKYLAFIKGKDDFRVVPINHWVLFHKKERPIPEEEYNIKYQKIDEDMVKLTKGNRSHKRLLNKRQKEQEESDENNSDREKNEEIFIDKPKNSLKRKRKNSDGNEPDDNQSEEDAFFQQTLDKIKNTQKKRKITPSSPTNEPEQSKPENLSAINQDDSENLSDESIDNDFPELS